MASLLASFVICVILNSAVQSAVAQKPVPVTDDNWRIVLEGEWMVEFMAPWCPACRTFTPVWEGFAEWSKDLDMKVGVVDVTESPGLSGRFMVTSLPTVLHVKDGEFRVYSGPRKENDLLSFVDDKKWEDVDTVSAWIHPNSIQMSAVGFLFKIAMMIRHFYTVMSTEYGIPEWLCYILFAVATIIVGLLFGLIIVLCCDRLFPPKYVPAHEIPRPNVDDDDKGNDSDVIEDINQIPDMATANHDAGDTSVRRRQTAPNPPDPSQAEGATGEAASSS